MSYYNVCPRCGAHLDPGEPCDCTHGPDGSMGRGIPLRAVIMDIQESVRPGGTAAPGMALPYGKGERRMAT